MINEEKFDIDFKTHNNLVAYAKSFSEGNETLENVLLNLWNHNIKTVACCKGHDYDNYFFVPYLSFLIEDNNNDYINNIINSKIFLKKSVSYNIHYNNHNDCGIFSIYMRDGIRDEILNSINDNSLMISKKKEYNKLLEYSINIIEYAKNNNYEFDLESNNGVMHLQLNRTNERTQIIEDPLTLDSAIDTSNEIPIGYFTCNIESLKKLNDLILKNMRLDS